MDKRIAELKEEMFLYLDGLRESGVTNMYGARPYLATEFHIDKIVAGKILSEWMQIFSERHKKEAI